MLRRVSIGYQEFEDIISNNLFLKAYGLSDKFREVKRWYDGFTFGNKTDIYNPWSVIHYLDKQKVGPYWANTSSNSLIGKVIREGSCQIKESFECLLAGESITTQMDEQIVYHQLDLDKNAIWSLFLASGYLKIAGSKEQEMPYGDWKIWFCFSRKEGFNRKLNKMLRSKKHGVGT